MNAIADGLPGPKPDRGGAAEREPLPGPERFEGIDKAIIVLLILVFGALFVWLTYRPDQKIFQYWVFSALLTLVFAGVLRAVGVVRAGWLALGGSVAVYVGLLWATQKTFEKHVADTDTIAALQRNLVDIRTEKIALQSDIINVKADLDRQQGQDLRIVAFNAANRRTIQFLKFRYGLRGGAERDAAYNRDEQHYVIPGADVGQIEVIWIEFNPLGPGGAERLIGAGGQGTIKVERLNLRPRPLQLDLYFSFDERSS